MAWPDDSLTPEYMERVSLGLVPGTVRAFGLGYAPDVDTATVPQDAWGQIGLFNWMTGLTSLEVVSTSASDTAAGTGARTVTFNTLVGDFQQQSQVITLNGLTPVPIPTQAIANNGGRVLTAGSAENNVGDIILRDAGGGTVRGIILAGKGTMRQAPYTVPAGKTLLIPSIFLGVDSPTGAVGKFAAIETYFKSPTGAAILPLYLGNTNSVGYNHISEPPIVVTERNRFALRIVKVSDNNTIVSALWNGILRDNPA